MEDKLKNIFLSLNNPESRRRLAGVFLFILIFFIYHLSPVITSSDSITVISSATSIITEGNADLNEYPIFNAAPLPYQVEKINDRLYPYYPIGAIVFFTPFVLFFNLSYKILFHSDLIELLYGDPQLGLEKFIASVINAFVIYIFYLLALKATKNNIARSLIASLIFALCTSMWSMSSRALWQHGPSILMMVASIYILITAEQEKKQGKNIPYIGLFMAAAYTIRPTNFLPALLFTVYVFLYHRRQLWRFLFYALLVAVPFFIYNLSVYHQLLPMYFTPREILANPRFFYSLAVQFFSPGRGLFLFSPILLFSFYGIYLKYKNKSFYKFDYFLLLIALGHTIIAGAFIEWWYGHAIGPRLLIETLPILLYFMIPVIGELKITDWRQKIITVLFISAALASLFIHYRSSTNQAVWLWNIKTVDVNKNPARVWDWCDIQFLNGINYCDLDIK